MALLTMVQSLAPGVGPAVGGFLGAWFGWRSIFVMLVALGLVTLAGVVFALPGAALFFAVAATGTLSVVTVLGPMILFSVGVGAASPVAITAAISTDPQLIGAASGLYGFMQMANGAVCTLMVGLIPADPAF